MKPEFEKGIKMLMSMCYDCLNKGITQGTFINNLKLMVIYFEENKNG